MVGSELGEQEGEKEQKEAVMFVRVLQELSSCMEAIEEHKDKEDQSETSMGTERECMCNIMFIIDLPPVLNPFLNNSLYSNGVCTISSGIC